MRDDEELALKLNGNINMNAISSVSTRLLQKPDFILRSIANGFTVIEGVPQELKTNREFVSNALEVNPLSIVFIGSHFRDDLELAKEALFHPQLLEFKEYGLVAKLAARTLNQLEHPMEFNFACNLANHLVATLEPEQAMEVIRNNHALLHHYHKELSVEFMEEMCEIHAIVKLKSKSFDFERFLQLRMNYEYQGGNITDYSL